MPTKRRLRPRRVRKIRRVPKAGPLNVTRAEFDAVITLLNERSKIINGIQRELESLARELTTQVQQNRRELQTQFTRMAQIQQELDDVKRKRARK